MMGGWGFGDLLVVDDGNGVGVSRSPTARGPGRYYSVCKPYSMKFCAGDRQTTTRQVASKKWGGRQRLPSSAFRAHTRKWVPR